MSKNWVNDIIDEAVKEVQSWQKWMQEGSVRVKEPKYKNDENNRNS